MCSQKKKSTSLLALVLLPSDGDDGPDVSVVRRGASGLVVPLLALQRAAQDVPGAAVVWWVRRGWRVVDI